MAQCLDSAPFTHPGCDDIVYQIVFTGLVIGSPDDTRSRLPSVVSCFLAEEHVGDRGSLAAPVGVEYGRHGERSCRIGNADHNLLITTVCQGTDLSEKLTTYLPEQITTPVDPLSQIQIYG